MEIQNEETLRIRRGRGREYWSNIPAVLVVSPLLTSAQLRVYLVLDSYAEAEAVEPSYKVIANKACISRASSFRCINELVAIGLLEKEASYREKDGRQLSNQYILNDYSTLIERKRVEIENWSNARDAYEKVGFSADEARNCIEQAQDTISIIDAMVKKNEQNLFKMETPDDAVIVLDGREQYVHIKREILFDEKITPNQFRVYLVLCIYKNLPCVCPDLDTISAKAQLSKKTVVGSIDALIDLRYITKNVGLNSMLGRLSNVYTILK